MTTTIASQQRLISFIAAVGSGLAAGVFFAFSTFVMTGLRRLPPAQGLSAMQAINRAAPTPLFMIPLLGTALICLLAAIAAARSVGHLAATLRLVAALLYLSAIALTIVYHVPHNNALAALDPSAPGSATSWRTYARNWTLWNHLRTLTSLGAAALFTASLRVA